MSNTPTSSNQILESARTYGSVRPPKPPWLKVRLPAQNSYFEVSAILKRHHLHTICQSAKCPNVAECWTARTATFLILGDTCTRRCAFCAVKKGEPTGPFPDEPRELAEAVARMGLDYAVITSVTRDDLADGGSSAFARTIRAIKEKRPQTKVEVLVPDFQGAEDALRAVIAAGPDVVNHNLETTEPGYPRINRPAQNYRRSLQVLEKAKKLGALTKSGLMVGLEETHPEIEQALSDLRGVGCDLLTVGQYLQPSQQNLPVSRYYTPPEFEEIRRLALALGFKAVAAGPLVRSSYQARELFRIAAQGGA